MAGFSEPHHPTRATLQPHATAAPQQCVLGDHSPTPALEPSLTASGPLALGALVPLSRARRAAWSYQRQKEPGPSSGPRSASGQPYSQRLTVEREARPHHRASERGIQPLREKPDPGVREEEGVTFALSLRSSVETIHKRRNATNKKLTSLVTCACVCKRARPQSCPILCGLMTARLAGFFSARVLEWVAISSSS